MNDTPSRADTDPAARLSDDDVLAPEADLPSVPQTDSPSDPDAVLILKVKDENGISTNVVPLGNVEPTEVATLIELGLASWRQKIGLRP